MLSAASGGGGPLANSAPLNALSPGGGMATQPMLSRWQAMSQSMQPFNQGGQLPVDPLPQGGQPFQPGLRDNGQFNQAMMQQVGGDFHNALLDWRQQRPVFGGNLSDWRSQMVDWRQQRPGHGSLGFGNPFNPGGPVMTPGGGMTGGPIPGTPAPVQTQVPPQSGGVGYSLGVIGAQPSANPYQLPNYTPYG